MSSIVLGIAALVAIFSLGDHVRNDINDQAKALLGSDLVIESNKAPDSTLQNMLDTLGNQRSRECRFASMVYFTKNNGTRLVQVLALEGDNPYYGGFETVPVAAGIDFRKGKQALVDRTLMLQFDAKVGDTIRVGELSFVIGGMLTQAPAFYYHCSTGIYSFSIPSTNRVAAKGKQVYVQLLFQVRYTGRNE